MSLTDDASYLLLTVTVVVCLAAIWVSVTKARGISQWSNICGALGTLCLLAACASAGGQLGSGHLRFKYVWCLLLLLANTALALVSTLRSKK